MSKRLAIIVFAVIIAAALGYTAIGLNRNHKQPNLQSHQSEQSQSNSPDRAQAEEQPSIVPKNSAKLDQPAGRTTDDQPADHAKPSPETKKPNSTDRKQAAGQTKSDARSHEGSFRLMRMAFAIAGLDKSDKNALKPAQAKKVLAILTPLRSKPKLTDDDAGKAVDSLKAVLTADQLKALENTRRSPQTGQRSTQLHGQGTAGERPGQDEPGRPPPRVMPPPGQNGVRPGDSGAPREGRAMRQHDPGATKDFNPFYAKPAKDNPMMEMQAKMIDRLFENLKKIAEE